MSDVFLSYKHAQGEQARQLVTALASHGWTVWWDFNIEVNEAWQRELDKQLNAAGCVVVVWSADAVTSEWVLYEARHALQAGKLVQVLLDASTPPPDFGRFQGANLAGWDPARPFHAGYDKLCAAIRALIDQRAPVVASRSGSFVRSRDEAGDLLQRGSDADTVRARPSPVMLPPAPFPDLLDRRDERAVLEAALTERKSISLAGPEGAGKSALLANVANLDLTGTFHSGVVYLPAAAQSERDLAQAVHEAFFDVPRDFHPTPVQVRQHLQDKTALLVLDDVGLPPAALDSLSGQAPRSVWIFASDAIAASARRRSVALPGLPEEDGVTLFERALGRALIADERAAVAQIVQAVAGHPARIEQAAGVAIQHGVAAALAAAPAVPGIAAEDARHRRVLAALACGGGVPLEAHQCGAIAQVEGVEKVLADLLKRGLIQFTTPGFKLAAGVAPQVEATPEFTAGRERATAVFAQFAFASRGAPRSVARLAAPMIAQMEWAAQNGHSADALRLARALDGPLAESNRWDAWRDMLGRAYDIAKEAGDDASAAWALHQQGTRAVLEGEKTDARRLLNEARNTRKRIGDSAGLKATSNNLRFIGWARWLVLVAVLASLGVTSVGAYAVYDWFQRRIVAVAPGTHDFGALDLRAATPERAIMITNEGRVPVEVVDVKTQGPNGNAFVVGSSCDGITIPPKLACRLLVNFKPDAVGPREATIVIRMRDIDNPFLVSVRGLATATPIARLSPETLDFGETEIRGAGVNRRMTLRNEGSAPLAVSNVAIDGDATFRIVQENCRAAPLAPDAQCAIELRFAPNEPTASGARLVLADNASGSPRSVALTGTGHATPKLDLIPANIAFATQEIGTVSPVRPVRFRNAGNAPIEVQQVESQGSAAFRVQGKCAGATLAPGDSCTLNVQFAPSAAEAANGRLVVRNSAGGARTIELSGNGIAIPRLTVAPQEVRFGVVKAGAPSQPRQVTIASTGSGTLQLETPAIAGDRRFSLTNNCPQQLPPDRQCSIEVGFDASGVGTASGRLVIAHNAGAPTSLPLSAEVARPQAPAILAFDANPRTVVRRGNVELCYRASNALRLTLQPQGSQPTSNVQGCVTRLVVETTTFVLTASGEGGTQEQANATVVVTIPPEPRPTPLPIPPLPLPTPKPPPTPQPQPPPVPAPEILRFTAVPSPMAGPGEARLCFLARNAEVARIDGSGNQPASPNDGCVSRAVRQTTTFRLTVSRKGAPAQVRDVQVEVRTPPKPTPPPTGGVILKDAPVQKAPATKPIDATVKATPPLKAQMVTGWCCRLGTVTKGARSACTQPGLWFGAEGEARKACAAPVVR